jgi:hypothetical protein
MEGLTLAPRQGYGIRTPTRLCHRRFQTPMLARATSTTAAMRHNRTPHARRALSSVIVSTRRGMEARDRALEFKSA